MLALSDAAVTGVWLAVVAVIGTGGTVIVTLLTRSTRAESRAANDGVDTLLSLLVAAREAESACLEALEVALASKTPAELKAARAHSAKVDRMLAQAVAGRKANRGRR